MADLPPAGPCLSEERLLAFYRGLLDEALVEGVREHLASCPACLELARDVREFLAAMRGRVRPREATPRRAPSGLVRRRTTLWALAAALAVVSGLAVYDYLVTRRPPPVADLVWRGESDSAEYDAAMEHFHAGRFEAAEVALESYVLAHPADDRARLDLAVSRLRVGRTADARRELTRLAEEGDETIRAEARRWLLELDQGRSP